MAVQNRVHRIHGTFHHLQNGDEVRFDREEDGVVAVVSGRVRLELSDETMILRASDAVSIPAHTSYGIEALEDSVLYAYAEHEEAPLPWGV